MSFGPFSPHNKYAPGLGAEYDSKITKILNGWRKAGIGQMKESRRGRR